MSNMLLNLDVGAFLKCINKKRSKKQTIPLLVSNSNVSFTVDIDIANFLASQFKSIYISDNGILPFFP